MRHRKVSRKLSRRTGHRTATLKALVINLFTHQRIETTLAKAKEARSFAERLITKARKDNVAARRLVFARLRDKKIIGLLFKDIAPRFNGRPGGYTRIMRLGKARAGDGAEMAILELVEQKVKEPPKPKKEKKKETAEKRPEVKEIKKEAVKPEPEKKPVAEVKKVPEPEKKPKEEKKVEAPPVEKKEPPKPPVAEKKPAEEKAPETKPKEEKPKEEEPKKAPPKKGFLSGIKGIFKKKE